MRSLNLAILLVIVLVPEVVMVHAAAPDITNTIYRQTRLSGTNRAVLRAPPGMVLIPAGSFTMGDSLDGDTDAIPTNVTVSAFYMDKYIVTRSLWLSVFSWATNHGYVFACPECILNGPTNNPATGVNWLDAVEWCNARSEQAGLKPVYYTDAGLTAVYTIGRAITEKDTFGLPNTGKEFSKVNTNSNIHADWTASGYRLPTEAEWEKAARGGLNRKRFPWGDTISHSNASYFSSEAIAYDVSLTRGYHPNHTNISEVVKGISAPVGYFAPNGFGLYDMAGLASEWCWDWYGTPYAGGCDPRGPQSGQMRVKRGGSSWVVAVDSRCAKRAAWHLLLPQNVSSPTSIDIGFRCVRAASQ
jgi:sulfatase modifying factor 1